MSQLSTLLKALGAEVVGITDKDGNIVIDQAQFEAMVEAENGDRRQEKEAV